MITTDPVLVTPLAKHSETSQNYILPIVAKHIQRKEHLLTCSSLFPNSSSIEKLINNFFEEYQSDHKESKIYLILLLSFLTGVSVKEWILLQNKRVKKINSRQQLIFKEQQYFLSTKFSIFENKNFKYSDLLNNTIYLDLPIPNEFIESLKSGKIIEEQQIYSKLKILRKKYCIPGLSLIKVSSLLHHTVFNCTGDQQLADLISGKDANQTSSISYCHRPSNIIQRHYIETIKNMCLELSNLYTPTLTDLHTNFGSRKAPQNHVVKDIFSIMACNIYQQAEEDWVEILNHYSIWLWHLLLLFTAARPVTDFPGSLQNFNLKRKIFFVSDKEVGGRKGDGRIIPLCDFVVDEINKYLIFIKKIRKYLVIEHPYFDQHLSDILESRRPLLNIFNDEKFTSLSPSLVRSFNPELGLDHANWHRHTTRAFLTTKVEETLILALFAHEPMQQEAAHSYSSLPFSQYLKLRDSLAQMQHEFKIFGVELDAII